MIYHTRGEYTNYYTTDLKINLLLFISKQIFFMTKYS